VTLIISVATPKVIVQASDRRLSRKDNGNLVVVEDEENKALYLICKDARVYFVYLSSLCSRCANHSFYCQTINKFKCL